MDNTQTQLNVGGQDLSQTQNPQAIPSQTLGAPVSNLQAPTSSLLTQSDLKITSVGSSEFRPLSQAPPVIYGSSTTTSDTPLLIGGIIVLAAFILLVVIAAKKAHLKSSS